MAFGGYLQANTAVDLMVGPFVDETDGKTAETGLTVTQAEVRLSKNGGNMAQKNEATALAHDELGDYMCKLDTTDTNTEGILTLMIHESGALPIKMDYMVLSQAAYISHVTAKDAGFMDVNIKSVGRADAQETEANNLESACSNYSVTRGLTGTAVPAAVADAAGGLAISDAGGLDLDAILADTAEIGAAVGASISADIAAIKAETALIVADTNELQTDDIPGTLSTNDTSVDTQLAAIKAETALIVEDTGTTLDALIKDVPTVAEFEARSDTAGTAATPAEVATALTTYDAPTKAEMDTAHGLLATVAKQDVIDALIDAIKVVTDNMAAAATTMITGIVSWENTNATTTVIFSDDVTEATADHYNGRLFVPTSGALLGQYTDITDYALDTGEGKFTVTALTEPPADNSTFVIL